jgi:hypothetical protein
MVLVMKMVRYMSLIFRGVVEDYKNTGIHPSVFMDSGGSLHIYLCDPVVHEIGEEDESKLIESCEMNGGQIVETVTIVETTSVNNNIEQAKSQIKPKSQIGKSYI